jgi:hypothetical protein
MDWSTPENSPAQAAADPPGDAELGRLIGAWPTLPAALKAAVMALVDAAEAERTPRGIT